MSQVIPFLYSDHNFHVPTSSSQLELDVTHTHMEHTNFQQVSYLNLMPKMFKHDVYIDNIYNMKHC